MYTVRMIEPRTKCNTAKQRSIHSLMLSIPTLGELGSFSLQNPFESNEKLATKNVIQNVAFEACKKNSSHWTYLDSQRQVQCSLKSGHTGKASSEDGGLWATPKARPERQSTIQQIGPRQQVEQKKRGGNSTPKANPPSPPNFHPLFQEKPEVFPQNRSKSINSLLATRSGNCL